MSMKLLEAVYQLDKNATTATEQAVLAALAYRANDKTHLCFPKQETIAAMTHLHRATVVSCLNSLRERGFIEWKSGGLTKKRGKYGQPLANDYTLKIPVGKEKSKVKALHEPVHNSGAMSPTTTPQCRPGRHCNVAQDDTVVSPRTTPTEITTEKATEISNRKENHPESGLDSVLKGMFAVPGSGTGGKTADRREECSPVRRALQVCGILPGSREYRDNYLSFASVMMKIGAVRSMEAVLMFESEMRQGEHASIRRPAALLMARLNRLA